MQYRDLPQTTDIASMPGGTFEIREGALEDAAALQTFMVNLATENLRVLFRRDRPPTIEEEREFIQKLSSDPQSVLLLATAGNDVVGVLDFHGGKRQRAHTGEFGISVAKPWRRRGVATALIGRLLQWAKERNFRRVGLQVFHNNDAAVRLYERLDFVHEGRMTEAIEVDGAFIDLLLMSRLI